MEQHLDREIGGKQTKDPFAAHGQRGGVTTSCSWSHPFRSKVGGTDARGWFSDSRAVSSADTVAALCRPHTGLAHLTLPWPGSAPLHAQIRITESAARSMTLRCAPCQTQDGERCGAGP